MQKAMDVKLNDRIEYMIAMISEFATHHGMTPPQSFRYLQRFGGIEFIDKYYNVNHTLSFESMVDDLTEYCRKKGGALV
jgi:hypothetical protein